MDAILTLVEAHWNGRLAADRRYVEFQTAGFLYSFVRFFVAFDCNFGVGLSKNFDVANSSVIENGNSDLL